jgi:hypothetical protein
VRSSDEYSETVTSGPATSLSYFFLAFEQCILSNSYTILFIFILSILLLSFVTTRLQHCCSFRSKLPKIIKKYIILHIVNI